MEHFINSIRLIPHSIAKPGPCKGLSAQGRGCSSKIATASVAAFALAGRSTAIAELTGARLAIASFGPAREQTIFV